MLLFFFFFWSKKSLQETKFTSYIEKLTVIKNVRYTDDGEPKLLPALP